MKRIATILTVFNRKQKTISCLQNLFSALDAYNCQEQQLTMSVFMTDDGCTDGTAEAVRMQFATRDVRIIQGTGKLFWAGGMRLAWSQAVKSDMRWDYYLLLNDDAFPFENALFELMETSNYSLLHYGRRGICSGATCAPGNQKEITYGGEVFAGKAKGVRLMLYPMGKPQMIDITHANILLIHHSVVDEIGIFYDGYVHSGADNDYSMEARKKNIPVLLTPHVCGECERDHDSNKSEIEHLIHMTLKERKHYVKCPTHSDTDYLLFVRRQTPLRYPQALILRTIRVYLPKLYCFITNARGVYKSH